MTTADGILRAMAEGRTVERGVNLAGDAENVDLPMPPSTNNLFATLGRRRVKSPEYRAWIDSATPFAMTLRPVPTVPFGITITVVGCNPGSDIANREKAVVDLLVATKRIPGDSVRAGLHEIVMRYVECGEGESYVRIEMRSL